MLYSGALAEFLANYLVLPGIVFWLLIGALFVADALLISVLTGRPTDGDNRSAGRWRMGSSVVAAVASVLLLHLAGVPIVETICNYPWIAIPSILVIYIAGAIPFVYMEWRHKAYEFYKDLPQRRESGRRESAEQALKAFRETKLAELHVANKQRFDEIGAQYRKTVFSGGDDEGGQLHATRRGNNYDNDPKAARIRKAEEERAGANKALLAELEKQVDEAAAAYAQTQDYKDAVEKAFNDPVQPWNKDLLVNENMSLFAEWAAFWPFCLVGVICFRWAPNLGRILKRFFWTLISPFKASLQRLSDRIKNKFKDMSVAEARERQQL